MRPVCTGCSKKREREKAKRGSGESGRNFPLSSWERARVRGRTAISRPDSPHSDPQKSSPCIEVGKMEAELIKILPSILWFFLAAAVLVLFYKPIRDDLLPNLSGFKAGGVELSFVKESIEAAIELAEKSPQWTVVVSAADK